jgi:hypothetical protein
MLWVMLRACYVKHPASGGPPSFPGTKPKQPMLRPMLWPVLCATSNIRIPPPLLFLDTKPNITCLQHRNSTSATLKFNVCNIQHQGPSFFLALDTTPNITCLQHRKLNIRSIKNWYLQHWKYLDLIFKHAHGTLTTCQEQWCKMCTTIATWMTNDCIMKANDCNMPRTLLWHRYTIIATSKRKKIQNRMRRELPTAHAPATAAGALPRPWRQQTAELGLARSRGRRSGSTSPAAATVASICTCPHTRRPGVGVGVLDRQPTKGSTRSRWMWPRRDR